MATVAIAIRSFGLKTPRSNGRFCRSIRAATSAAARPVHYQDILPTIYHNLGIDPHAMITDRADRPAMILPATAEAIRDLVG
jgi:hypothetical protein